MLTRNQLQKILIFPWQTGKEGVKNEINRQIRLKKNIAYTTENLLSIIMGLRVSIKDKHPNDKMSNGYRSADHRRNPKTIGYGGCSVLLWAGMAKHSWDPMCCSRVWQEGWWHAVQIIWSRGQHCSCSPLLVDLRVSNSPVREKRVSISRNFNLTQALYF